MNKARIVGLLACCGLASPVAAQPFLVNISGATLLESFLVAPSSTRDFVDLDGDGECGNCPSPNDFNEQLASTGTTVGLGLASDYFVIQYTAVGSGNGIADLDTRGACRPDSNGVIVDGVSNYIRGFDDVAGTTPDNPFGGAPGSPTIVGDDAFISSNVANGFFNRIEFNNGGLLSTPANTNNPRAYPVRSTIDGTYLAVNSTNNTTHGIQIDLAPTDVPVAWFVEQAGTPNFDDVPNEAGYGKNPIQGVSKDGSADVRDNTLIVLQNTNTNTASPDNCTIFDNPLTLAPVAAIVNYGVGMSQIDLSDLRHGLVSGRRLNGENLVFATRDSGSGTRNGFANGVCLDPSWAMGDNVGARQSSSSNDNLGPNWQPTNMGGSSRMDAVVLDSRLAIGHTGAERLTRYKTANDGTGGLDVLAVRDDINGSAAATYNRPFIDNLLDNSVDFGYNIIGPGNIASIGSRTAVSGPAQMENGAAADYLNNIAASVAAFSSLPGGDETLFSPGEFLAFRFIPVGATDFVAGPNGACDLVPAATNQALQDFVRSTSALGAPAFEFFDFTATGDAPSRQTGITYLDGVPGGTNYISESGASVAYGSQLDQRNKIAGDFNGDLLRNADDIDDLVGAWEERFAGGSWTPPSGVAGPGADFVLDIVGDFNGDGNFDTVDARYFLDGLALDTTTGNLDRAAAFVAADAASTSGNLFSTTLATGAAYTAGASAADVAGAAGTTPGFHPIGADGIVGAADLDYIALQFDGLADAQLDWANTTDAATPARDGSRRDLSADVNGDLVVNIDDICATLAFLNTTYGDVNLDGVKNATDSNIIAANQGQPGGWADGDITGDGVVDAADTAAFNTDPCGGNPGRLCADVNENGVVEPGDFTAWVAAFNGGDLKADANQNGANEPGDFTAWVAAYNLGAAGPICTP